MTKHTASIRRIALAALFFLLFHSPAFASNSNASSEKIGEVIHLMGTVFAIDGNQQQRRLTLTSEVFKRDTISTGLDGNVEIRFTDETLYSQGAGSSVTLDDFVFSEKIPNSKLLFTITRGTFRLVTGEIVKRNPNNFVLQTPLTTLGIRGTEPFGVIDDDREEIGVLEISPRHQVVVTSVRNEVSIKGPGLQTSVLEGGTLSQPDTTEDQTRNNVIETAPMTSQGEWGPYGSRKDLRQKVKGFEDLLQYEKRKIKNFRLSPNYRRLRTIALQTIGLEYAKDQLSGKIPPRGSDGISGSIGASSAGDDGDDDGDDGGDD